MPDNVTCLKHQSATVFIGDHPEHGPVYRCLHNPDCMVAAEDGGLQRSWTEPSRPSAPTCSVFRCQGPPAHQLALDYSGRKIAINACDLHAAAIEAGESWGRVGGHLYMGADYDVKFGGSSTT